MGNYGHSKSIASKSKESITPGRLTAGEESSLISRINNGDMGAFDTVYNYYYPRLLEFAFRYLQSREAAEDVVQETMFAIWRNRATWNVTSGLSVYLYGAVRNRSLQIARHQAVVQRFASTIVLDEVPGAGEQPGAPDKVAESQDTRRHLTDAVESLTEAQKRVLLLRWQDELTGGEIAEVLGISVEAAWKQVRRAELALKSVLEKKNLK